jgi:large subunit ribosomal protein L15
VVNLKQLAGLAGSEVTPETLAAAGLVGDAARPIKLLATGEAERGYTVRGVALSASARAKIEAAGGTVEGG